MVIILQVKHFVNVDVYQVHVNNQKKLDLVEQECQDGFLINLQDNVNHFCMLYARKNLKIWKSNGFFSFVCFLFSWGGCLPNGNNFLSLAACARRCPPRRRQACCCLRRFPQSVLFFDSCLVRTRKNISCCSSDEGRRRHFLHNIRRHRLEDDRERRPSFPRDSDDEREHRFIISREQPGGGRREFVCFNTNFFLKIIFFSNHYKNT